MTFFLLPTELRAKIWRRARYLAARERLAATLHRDLKICVHSLPGRCSWWAAYLPMTDTTTMIVKYMCYNDCLRTYRVVAVRRALNVQLTVGPDGRVAVSLGQVSIDWCSHWRMTEMSGHVDNNLYSSNLDSAWLYDE